MPLINAQLNGVFTLSLGAGYFWAREDVGARRGYFWVAGVLAKGLGALLFLFDHFTQGSPVSYLVFVLTDGGLCLLTLALLRRKVLKSQGKVAKRTFLGSCILGATAHELRLLFRPDRMTARGTRSGR